MPMQPSPWRETWRPWVPRAIVSMRGCASGRGLTWPTLRVGQWWPDVSVGASGVRRDGVGPHEDGAAALLGHDAVELRPVLVAPAGGLEDRPDGPGHVQAEVRAVAGTDEAHRARDGGPFPAVLEHEGRPARGPQQGQLSGAAAHHRRDPGGPVHGIVDDAGAHD